MLVVAERVGAVVVRAVRLVAVAVLLAVADVAGQHSSMTTMPPTKSAWPPKASLRWSGVNTEAGAP